MHLIYLDESGNTGQRLNDPQQPIFVLGGLIVHEECWQGLERDLVESLGRHLPAIDWPKFEIHGTDLRNGSGGFRRVEPGVRIALRDDWLGIASRHKLGFAYAAIDKLKFQEYIKQEMGIGVTINPYIMAFSILAHRINLHLIRLGEKILGMFICDENKEIVRDIERVIHKLRLAPGRITMNRFVEKGFFIDSKKSRILQLCDLCVFQARKKEEILAGWVPKSFDTEGIVKIEPLMIPSVSEFDDLYDWLNF